MSARPTAAGRRLTDAFIAEADRLLSANGTIIVAVSGGADSVALLELLAAARRWQLVVWHLDHALRPESGEDAAFVRALAAELGCEAAIERVEVAAEARRRRVGIEQAGRTIRYERLAALARARGAAAIVTAHHRDDQAETVLMNLLRGAGARGARGLPESRDLDGIPLVRPLLPFTRDELREHLRARGRFWREDASNADERFRRNVIRRRALPLLEAAEPGFTAALLRWSARAIDAGDGTRWRALLDRLGVEPTRERVRLVDELAHGRPGRRLHLGEWLLRREGDDVAFESAAPRGAAEPVTMPDPGPYARGDETLTLAESATPADARTPPGEAWLDAERLRWPLVWRVAAPGEIWTPLGSPGRQAVRKYLADRKVPARARPLLGVVADADGVVWIPGHGIAERVKLSPGTRRALHGRLAH